MFGGCVLNIINNSIERMGNSICYMSLIPAGCTLPDDAIGNAWMENRDGAGYCFAVDGTLIIRKGFFKLKELKAAFADDHSRYGLTSAFGLHLRYATHGHTNDENCHPHPICGGKAALLHNGLLSDFDPPTLAMSDTRWFCETVLAYRCTEHVMDATFNGLLEDMIGWNKFILMDNLGAFSIVNERLGSWDNGIWHSNDSYLPPKPRAIACGYGVSNLPIRYTGCSNSVASATIVTKYASSSGRPDEWDAKDRLAETAYNDILAEFNVLEMKINASTDYKDLTDDEWDRHTILCDLLDEWEISSSSRMSGGNEQDYQTWVEEEERRESEAMERVREIDGMLDNQMDGSIVRA